MRVFPDAQLVHIIRDPRDCVASLKHMPWWKQGSYHSVLAWMRSIDLTARAARRWPVAQVQYERLVADPEGELRALCAVLGEEYDPAMAKPERLASSIVPDRRWHRRTRRGPATTAHIGRWRGALEPWELQLCETVLGERMETLGYELTGCGPPHAAHLLRYRYVRATSELHRHWERIEDRKRQLREPNPVAAQLTSGQLVGARP
jgi:hypothetical protein